MSAVRRWAALTTFELRRQLAAPVTWAGLGVFVVVLVIGAIAERSALLGVTGMLGLAHATGVLVILRFGLAADRDGGFLEYLGANFTGAAALVTSRSAAACALLVVFGVAAVLLAAALSPRDAAYVAWSVPLYTAVWLALAPLVLLVELASGIRMPAAAVAALGVVLGVATVAWLGERIIDFARIVRLPPHEWGAVLRFVAACTITALLGFALVAAGWTLRQRWRSVRA